MKRSALIVPVMLCAACSMPFEPYAAGVADSKTVHSYTFQVERGASYPQSFGLPQPVRLETPSESILDIGFDLNPEVDREISRYAKMDRLFIEQSLKNRQIYLPKLRSVFEEERVPYELLNVAAIESLFRHDVKSPRGAAGMWQFTRETAKKYGLKITKARDERKDPIRSSEAAVKHLRDLHDIYGDWPLALAAYNAGTGRIGRLLAKTGAKTFWELVRSGKLAEETARFVPKVIALSLIAKDPAQYGFTELAHLQDLEQLSSLG